MSSNPTSSIALSSSHDYYDIVSTNSNARVVLGNVYHYQPPSVSNSGTRTCDQCLSQSQSQSQFNIRQDTYELRSASRAPTQQRLSVHSTSTSVATTTSCLGRLTAGWNIFNTVITLVLAAAALAIGVVYGMMSANQNQQNLKLTIWRDCIDLAVSFLLLLISSIDVCPT